MVFNVISHPYCRSNVYWSPGHFMNMPTMPILGWLVAKASCCILSTWFSASSLVDAFCCTFTCDTKIFTFCTHYHISIHMPLPYKSLHLIVEPSLPSHWPLPINLDILTSDHCSFHTKWATRCTILSPATGNIFPLIVIQGKS